MNNLSLSDWTIGEKQPLTVIAGPCVIESEEHAIFCAQELKALFRNLSFSFIFKASYDKANRSSLSSFRGPGLEKGLQILQRIQQEEDLCVLTDVHSPREATIAGEVCDMIQIPAFLCRQTDLLVAAAQTKAAINIKKGQFLAPWDMKNVVEKLEQSGAKRILLTDRGTMFGYNNLISDFRAIPIMQQLGYPVCFDATHSVQLPGGLGSSSGGQREFVPTLAKAAVASGCNALFLETHPNPTHAKSDAATSLSFEMLKKLLQEIQPIYQAVHSCS